MIYIDPETSAKLIIDNVLGYLDDLVTLANETLDPIGVMSGCASVIAFLATNARDEDGELFTITSVSPIVESMLNGIERELNDEI